MHIRRSSLTGRCGCAGQLGGVNVFNCLLYLGVTGKEANMLTQRVSTVRFLMFSDPEKCCQALVLKEK